MGPSFCNFQVSRRLVDPCGSVNGRETQSLSYKSSEHFATVSSGGHKPEAPAKDDAGPSLALQACVYRYRCRGPSLALPACVHRYSRPQTALEHMKRRAQLKLVRHFMKE